MLREILLEIGLLLQFLIDIGDVRLLGFLVLDVALLLMAIFYASKQFQISQDRLPRRSALFINTVAPPAFASAIALLTVVACLVICSLL